MSPKLNDDRVVEVKKKSELELNVETIMTSLTSVAKVVGEIHKDMTEIKRLAKAGRF
jgi:hypothetical protein